MLKRFVYTILGCFIGMIITIKAINDDYAEINAYNLALTYYRACTISTAYSVNKFKLSDEIRQDGYKSCWNRSLVYHKILLKNL